MNLYRFLRIKAFLDHILQILNVNRSKSIVCLNQYKIDLEKISKQRLRSAVSRQQLKQNSRLLFCQFGQDKVNNLDAINRKHKNIHYLLLYSWPVRKKIFNNILLKPLIHKVIFLKTSHSKSYHTSIFKRKNKVNHL